MGNKNSKTSDSNNGPCGECNCQSEVPRVIAACNKAGEQGVSNSLKQTIAGLAGEENAEMITNEITNALTQKKTKWVEDYNKIKVSFSEGFIEGNEECVKCDCVIAANEIIESCEKSTQQTPGILKDLVTTDNTFLSSVFDESNGKKEIESDWKKIYPNIKVTKGGIEGFSTNGGLYTITRSALASRHQDFKDTTTFQTDCRNNSYRSIISFINEEKEILDSLYNYYLTFIKDYESLYLHKEAFAKTMYNKLDELKRIQAKIDTYKTSSQVDNRKILYQSNNYEFYTNIRFYMLIVYYSVIVIYLIFSKFFSEKKYTNKVLVLLLVIYLIMPIILEHLINFAYEGYIYFLEYNNLKEDTKSYQDLISIT
jgi:hypothetical protein